MAVISSVALLNSFLVNYTWKQIPENSLGGGYFLNNLNMIYTGVLVFNQLNAQNLVL